MSVFLRRIQKSQSLALVDMLVIAEDLLVAHEMTSVEMPTSECYWLPMYALSLKLKATWEAHQPCEESKQ